MEAGTLSEEGMSRGLSSKVRTLSHLSAGGCLDCCRSAAPRESYPVRDYLVEAGTLPEEGMPRRLSSIVRIHKSSLGGGTLRLS